MSQNKKKIIKNNPGKKIQRPLCNERNQEQSPYCAKEDNYYIFQHCETRKGGSNFLVETKDGTAQCLQFFLFQKDKFTLDTTITGPWMKNWELTHMNRHTDGLKKEGGSSWHSHNAETVQTPQKINMNSYQWMAVNRPTLFVRDNKGL